MESAFHAWLVEQIPAHPRVVLGPGDDGAILAADHGRWVVAVDMLMDGVDFHLSACGARQAGRKAVAVNLSDLAAMAAEPRAAVVALAVHQETALETCQEFTRGALEMASAFDLAIAGGDTNTWDGPLAVSVTVWGESPREGGPLRRSGARPGDRLLATGAFGGSLVGRHLEPRPRVREALHLVTHYPIEAGIDVSDGLSLDASHLGTAGNCGIVLDLDRVPVHPDAEIRANETGRTPLEHALCDGEDFELVFAVSPDTAAQLLEDQPFEVPLTDIGYVIEEHGLWSVRGDSPRQKLTPRGFRHGDGEGEPV